ncbi:hypothetical protein [Micrococcus terreus]|uniref:hypothetical protein n=1 Tax=Micrococcus terreus TaxID=574650 RepID=UPI003D737560
MTTTTPLPGNPYGPPDIVEAIVFSADGSPTQTTEFLLDDLVRAVRSLAFEQRTANLIAYVKHVDDTDPAVLGQIFPRLGLDDPR